MSHAYRSQSKQRNENTQLSRSITPSSRKTNGRDDVLSKMIGDNDEVDDSMEDEELDPRVQDELERLNVCTDEINQLENELDDANCLFRSLLTDSTHVLKAQSTKIGGTVIEKARPYFEALDSANKAQKECQAAATAYQRAFGIHAAAKETIALAEERFLCKSKEWAFDTAWQEMLNHATIKVMAAEKQKTDSEAEHLMRAATYTAAEQEVQGLERKLQRYIQKSRPYFEQKDIFNKALESQKKRVQDLQEKVSELKRQYSRSLRNLEDISESIHARRKLRKLWSRPDVVGSREPGVGAELEFDLYTCDGASSRSTASGQSGAKTTSEWDSMEALESKNETLNDDLSDLIHQMEQIEVRTSQPIIKRTTSCPNKMSLDVMELLRNSSSNLSTIADEDCTVTGFQSQFESRIEL